MASAQSGAVRDLDLEIRYSPLKAEARVLARRR